MRWVAMVLSLGMCFSCFSSEEYRSFTDNEGRTIKAKIIQYDPRTRKVTIERDNRRRFTVSSSAFSESDQVYVEGWFLAQGFLSTYSVTEKKRKKPSSERNRSYEIKMRSNSKDSLERMWIEYCIYINRDFFDGSPELRVKGGRIDPIRLVPQKVLRVETEPVTLEIEGEIIEGYYDSYSNTYSDFFKTVSQDYLKGIRVRVYLKTLGGNVFMREVCSPSSLPSDKFPWEEYQEQPKKRRKKNRKKRQKKQPKAVEAPTFDFE